MNEQATCPECGKPLPEGSSHDLCPACLMGQVMASQTLNTVAGNEAVAPPPSPEEIADKFPQFEVVECLGRGGMGVVYKARQKSLDRWVAIKVLAPERVHEERFAEHFEREAKTLAKMSHPNIVTVFDHGQTDGLFYIVMEFVDGLNLRDLLREAKMEPEQALAIIPPICDALEYAHDKGVVHRDIKPENILLDRDGRVKIADFGIASLVGASGEKSGTPPYMAPEQENCIVDRRADIYALGAVLYEMLTGERPNKEIVAPSKKVQIDVRLDEVVLRALEKTPELRYQTAGEFRTMVETILTTSPSSSAKFLHGTERVERCDPSRPLATSTDADGARQARILPFYHRPRRLRDCWPWDANFLSVVTAILASFPAIIAVCLMPVLGAKSLLFLILELIPLLYVVVYFSILRRVDRLRAKVTPDAREIAEGLFATRVLQTPCLAILADDRLELLGVAGQPITIPLSDIEAVTVIRWFNGRRLWWKGCLKIERRSAPAIAIALAECVSLRWKPYLTGEVRQLELMPPKDRVADVEKPLAPPTSSSGRESARTERTVLETLVASPDGIGLATARSSPNPSGQSGHMSAQENLDARVSHFVALAAYISAYAGLLLLLASTASQLPPQVASHFGSEGRPNGWMGRTSYLALIGCMPLLFGGVAVLVSWMTQRLPARFINIPRGDFWLTPERRPETAAFLRRRIFWLAVLLTVFFSGVHLLIVQANQSTPARLSPDGQLTMIIAIFLALMVWTVSLLMRLAEVEKPFPKVTAPTVPPAVSSAKRHPWPIWLTFGIHAILLVILTGILVFSVPRFMAILHDMDAQLPLWIQLVFGVAEFTTRGGYLMVPIFMAMDLLLCWLADKFGGRKLLAGWAALGMLVLLGLGVFIVGSLFLSTSRIIGQVAEPSVASVPAGFSWRKVEVPTMDRENWESTGTDAVLKPVVTIDQPGIFARRYAIIGDIRYEGVEGTAYLEMWNHFQPSGSYFTRTLAPPGSGPMAVITGSSDWRAFTLPFDRSGTTNTLSKLEVNLHLPAKGKVFLRGLRLVEDPDASPPQPIRLPPLKPIPPEAARLFEELRHVHESPEFKDLLQNTPHNPDLLKRYDEEIHRYLEPLTELLRGTAAEAPWAESVALAEKGLAQSEPNRERDPELIQRAVSAGKQLEELLKAAAKDPVWGEPDKGASVRLRADKALWTSSEIPSLKMDLRNQGNLDLSALQSQEFGKLEVDGVAYWWTGACGLSYSPFPPGRFYTDIPVTLGAEWMQARDRVEVTPPPALRLAPGRHVIRFAPAIAVPRATKSDRGPGVSCISNPVEIEIVDSKDPATVIPMVWGEAVNGVAVHLQADLTAWTADEFPVVTAHVRNHGSAALQLSTGPAGNELEVDGKWHAWNPSGNTDLPPNSELAPGAECAIPLTLSGDWQAQSVPLALGVGQHVIRFAIRAKAADGKEAVRIISNPIRLDIADGITRRSALVARYLPGHQFRSVRTRPAGLEEVLVAPDGSKVNLAEMRKGGWSFPNPNLTAFIRPLRLKVSTAEEAQDITHLIMTVLTGGGNMEAWEFSAKSSPSGWQVETVYAGPPAQIPELRPIELILQDGLLVDMANAAEVKPAPMAPMVVPIKIAADGTLTVADQPCRSDQLAEKLANLANKEALSVVVHADEKVSFQQFQTILDTCKAAGINAVSVAKP